MPFSEYSNYDGLGLADLIRSHQISSVEVVEEAIRRIEIHNPALNAVVTKLYDRARSQVQNISKDAPFAGVPFLMKDLIAALKGVPTSSSSRLLKNIPANQDSELARRWQSAGLIILGKTNTPEFGLTPYTEPETFGPTRNPWDQDRSPGGSSGGSGAAVAARMVPLASGGDGGGSIRIPASACGLFGLKPTRGRTPTGPVSGEAWRGFAIEHALTRSVRDSAALLDATCGNDVGAPYLTPDPQGSYRSNVNQEPGKLRVAFTGKPFLGQSVHPEVLEGLTKTVRLLQDLGHELVEDAPDINHEEYSLAFLTIVAAEIRADMEEASRLAGKKLHVGDFDIITFGTGLFGSLLSASDYAASARYLQMQARQMGQFMQKYDVILTPTVSQPPVITGSLQPSASEKSLLRTLSRLDAGWLLKIMGTIKPLAAKTYEFIPWTPVFNVTGQPAMSVPLCWSTTGLPIGMHFAGQFGDEATLFRLAGQLERATPWFDRGPKGF